MDQAEPETNKGRDRPIGGKKGKVKGTKSQGRYTATQGKSADTDSQLGKGIRECWGGRRGSSGQGIVRAEHPPGRGGGRDLVQHSQGGE